MPKAFRRTVEASELDTAPLIWSFMVASASMNLLTVEPVPTPTISPGTTYCRAAWPTRALSSSWVMGSMGVRGLRQSGQRPRDDNPRLSKMSLIPYALARSFLFKMDAEEAHEFTLANLARTQNTLLDRAYRQPFVANPVTLAGLKFPNRVGLAAGLDKNARCIDGLGAMGFGFVEVGTVTPKAQPGNPKPRMFRLPQRDALINRLGFNNDGLDAFVRNVQQARCRQPGAHSAMRLGLNIGKNASTPIEDATSDY